MKNVLVGFAVVFVLGCCFVTSCALDLGGWFVGRSIDTVKTKFDPGVQFDHYEWFKDAYTQLEAKKANIIQMKASIADFKKQYGDTAFKDWDRSGKDQYNLLTQQLSGLIASFNSLAAEFNAAHSKINWKFANRGPVPKEVEQLKSE